MSDEDLEKKHPEFASPKETSYCLFEKKAETYIKNGEEKSYEQTTHTGKSEKVSCIVQRLVDSGESYLRHRKHVENTATVLLKLGERHKGGYIEMDFSENIDIKTKSEVQEAHFSGKQYALHCTIVQPSEVKFAYHLSDDATHDSSFVQQVLEDTFDRWEIRDETIVVKK